MSKRLGSTPNGKEIPCHQPCAQARGARFLPTERFERNGSEDRYSDTVLF